jgi:RNA polymerase sigma-70 factor (ECF subfamily)
MEPTEKSTSGREDTDDGTSLIARLRNGEQQVPSELHDRYAKVVYTLAFRVLQDSVAAEEVLQNVFSRLSRNPEAFDTGSGSLISWLNVNGRNPSPVGPCGRRSEIATEQSVITSDPDRRNESQRPLLRQKAHVARIRPPLTRPL